MEIGVLAAIAATSILSIVLGIVLLVVMSNGVD